MKRIWLLTMVCVMAAATPGCRRRAKAPPAAPETPAADATGAIPATTTAEDKSQGAAPPADTVGSVKLSGVTYTFANDPASVLTRAKATYSYRVDKFYEDRGRFPKSLAEAGLDKVPLPPGQRANYNPATGMVTIN